MNRTVLLCASIVLAAVPVAAQQPPSQFEVASVRPTPDTTIRGLAGIRSCRSPNRWCGRLTLVQYIGVAYPEYKFEGRIVGGPSWIGNEKFDIEALKDPSATTEAQIAPMMAHLLASRFALRTHVEQRPIDVYVLKMAHHDGKLGPRLKRSAAWCVEAKTARQSPPADCRGSQAIGMNRPVSQIADFLQYLSFLQIDRPVLDRTGLTGYFDFKLHYDYAPFGALAQFPGTFRTDGVSFFTALEEQWGLKLEPTREVMDVLVIDSVERPVTDQ